MNLLAYTLPSMSDDEAATAILAAVATHELPLSALHPLVLSYVVGYRRHEVRSAEREARLPAPRKSFPGADKLLDELRDRDATPNWRKLVTQSFRVIRGGNVVTWGQATVAEHLARAEALCFQGRAIASTAKLHRQAAEQLTAAHVSCLDDLLEVAA